VWAVPQDAADDHDVARGRQDMGSRSRGSASTWDSSDSWWGSSSWKDDKSSWSRDGGSWKSSGSWDDGKSSSHAESSWEKRGAKHPWQTSSSSGSSGGGSASWRGHEEQVQRWLGWALKGGHAAMGVQLGADGWTSLEGLAVELNKRRPDFGVADGIQFKELLETSDMDGRFEFDARGRVRKVERDQRQRRSVGAVAFQANGSAGSWAAPAGGGDRGPPPATVTVNGSRAAAPAEAAPAAATGAVDSAASNGQIPPNPPGEFWTEYVDDDVYWWYYEGPLGKWWMQETDTRPSPWSEE